jgi:hypothetical protein
MFLRNACFIVTGIMITIISCSMDINDFMSKILTITNIAFGLVVSVRILETF